MQPVQATNIRTGEVKTFPSMQQASHSLGINRKGIRLVLSGQRRQYGGYTFKKIAIEKYEI